MSITDEILADVARIQAIRIRLHGAYNETPEHDNVVSLAKARRERERRAVRCTDDGPIAS